MTWQHKKLRKRSAGNACVRTWPQTAAWGQRPQAPFINSRMELAALAPDITINARKGVYVGCASSVAKLLRKAWHEGETGIAQSTALSTQHSFLTIKKRAALQHLSNAIRPLDMVRAFIATNLQNPVRRMYNRKQINIVNCLIIFAQLPYTRVNPMKNIIFSKECGYVTRMLVDSPTDCTFYGSITKFISVK